MSDKDATFSINLDSNTSDVSDRDAASLEALRQKVDAATASIKNGTAALRALRGSSEEVINAKTALKARIDAEKSAVSSANLEILKQGTSYAALVTRSKAAKAATDDHAKSQRGLTAGIEAAGGPLDGIRAKLSSLKDMFSGANVGALLLGASMAILVVAVVAASTAFIAGTAALTKFAVTSSDAMRSLALTRQAIAGSAEDSARMGDQIDRLRQKIPLTTDEFSKLYASVRTSFDQSRVSGKGILDVVTLVGSATAAAGDQAASKLREIAERGKDVGRLQISGGFSSFSGGTGKSELAGTGVKFEDVAKQLAANTKTSLDQAKQALQRGSVSYVDGIKALREAAEKAYGEINAKKLISIDAITKRFDDDLHSLTKGINLEPFLQALSKIESLFSTTTPTGYALKTMFTALGNAFGDISKTGAPLVETAIKLVVLGMLKLTNVALATALGIKLAFKSDAAKDLSKALDVAAAAADGLSAPFVLAYKAAKALYDLVDSKSEVSAAKISIAGSPGGNTGFTGPSAPKSAVIAPAHAAGGIVAAPAPGEYFASVAPGEMIVPAGSGGGRGGSPVTIAPVFHIHASGSSPRELAQAVASPSILGQLTKAIEDACKSLGIPTQAAPT